MNKGKKYWYELSTITCSCKLNKPGDRAESEHPPSNQLALYYHAKKGMQTDHRICLCVFFIIVIRARGPPYSF
ncbi:MAG: hypothetical protein IJ274_10865 [Lachnospiraceae bacterium]|nr:hypothetical protein [Lachnospiraceae bacterium]